MWRWYNESSSEFWRSHTLQHRAKTLATTRAAAAAARRSYRVRKTSPRGGWKIEEEELDAVDDECGRARDDGGGSQGINEKGRKGWFFGGRWGFVPNFGSGFEGQFSGVTVSRCDESVITVVMTGDPDFLQKYA